MYIIILGHHTHSFLSFLLSFLLSLAFLSLVLLNSLLRGVGRYQSLRGVLRGVGRYQIEGGIEGVGR